MSSVFKYLTESNLLDSIAGFMRNVSSLQASDITIDLRDRIVYIASIIIPEQVNHIEEVLDQLELDYADKAGKLKIDREKLLMFQRELKRLLTIFQN